MQVRHSKGQTCAAFLLLLLDSSHTCSSSAPAPDGPCPLDPRLPDLSMSSVSAPVGAFAAACCSDSFPTSAVVCCCCA